MEHCCDNKATELETVIQKQRSVLWIVLIINALMFFVEGGFGIYAHSTSLIADSLDMLGDAFIYGFSLFIIAKNARWKAIASLLKGGIMLVLGSTVVIQATKRFLSPELPFAETMGWIGALALIANLLCMFLLLRHRDDDLNMRSTWLCSRNDVIANFGVLAAASAVSLTQSKIPDLVVGLAIAILIIWSSWSVLKESTAQLRGLQIR